MKNKWKMTMNLVKARTIIKWTTKIIHKIPMNHHCKKKAKQSVKQDKSVNIIK